MRSKILFVVLLAIVAAHPAAAQIAPSRLVGIVRDDQGGVLPGVTVTASSTSLLSVQSAISEVNGSYQFPSLPSGTYVLRFELQGFQTVARGAIQLDSGQTLTVDVQLPVASVQETVTVTAAAPVIDTTTTAIAGNRRPATP
jgi:Carboxypeptidase regulatory-like domain